MQPKKDYALEVLKAIRVRKELKEFLEFVATEVWLDLRVLKDKKVKSAKVRKSLIITWR